MLLSSWTANLCAQDSLLYSQIPAHSSVILEENENSENPLIYASQEGVFSSNLGPLSTPSVPRPYELLSHLKVSKLSLSYSTYSAITDQGLLYMWGRSTSGQCGVVTPSVPFPRHVNIATQERRCIHGISEAGERMLVTQVVNSHQATVALTKAGTVWTWGALGAKEPVIKPVILSAFGQKCVMRLAAGKEHFCALVKVGNGESVNVRREERDSIRYEVIDSCEKCSSERLSSLMNNATPLHLTKPPIEGECSPSDCLSEDGEFSPSSFKLELSHTSPAKSLTLPISNERKEDTQSVHTLPLNQRVTDLELKPMGKPLQTNSIERFSFVSMDLCTKAQAESSEEDTCTASSSNSVGDENISATNSYTESQKDYIKNQCSNGEIELPSHVWTWGNNTHGQLGHGDFVNRNEPSRIDRLNEALVTKVCAGDNHTVAVTATGEVYVWGSNAFGQLKQGESKNVNVPVVFKIGSQSSVLDLAAGPDFTLLVVNGLDCRPVIYYCGKNYEANKSDQNVTLRLSAVEKMSAVCSVECFGSQLVTWLIPLIESDSSDAKWTTAFELCFSELKFARDLSQLYSLANQIYQRAILRPSPKMPNLASLLLQFTQSLNGVSLLIGQSALQMRAVIGRWLPDERFDWLLRVAVSNEFCTALKQLHIYLTQLIAAGCFGDFDIGDTLSETVQRMSLDFETESRKSHRQLKKLFSFPFTRLDDYCRMVRNVSDLYAQGTEMNHFLTSAIIKWKTQSQLFHNVGHLAEKTYNFWSEYGTHAAVQNSNLRSSDRLLFKFYERYTQAQDSTIKGITSHGWNKNWHHVLVFNDSLVVVEKKEAIVLHYPLVWVLAQEHELKFLVVVCAPEVELTLEFYTFAAKSSFIQAVNQALLKYLHSGLYSVEHKAGATPPYKRRGSYKFGTKMTHLQGANYSGLWLFAKPHGSGKIMWPEGKAYVGQFANGYLHGYGTMRAEIEFRDSKGMGIINGFWKEGKLNGLAVVEYANSSVYEGFMCADQRHGHGVIRHAKGSIYVGEWKQDRRHGYGVWCTQRNKYLGMWQDDFEHGLGTLVCIDGTCYEGTFDKGVFVKGVMNCNDETRFEGDFNGLGVLSGKGKLLLANGDLVQGAFNGSLNNGQVQINNATLTRNPLTPTSPDADMIFECGGRVNNFCVPADQKWNEIFEQFCVVDLKQELYSSGKTDTSCAWNAMAAAVNDIKKWNNQHDPNNRKGSISTDPTMDILETIPSWQHPWSPVYHSMVKLYCTTAQSVKLHPISRLINALFEVFSASYSGISANPLLLDQAVNELTSLIRRSYETMSILFPSLPVANEMHELVAPGDVENSTDNDQSVISETAVSFITDKMVALCYASLFTLYAVHCEKNDHLYWTKITLWNTKSDVALLKFFDVDAQLWPIELTNTETLDAPMLCATAKGKYYAPAIDLLQQISCEFCPSAKLRVLKRVFEEVDKCVRLYSARSENHVWNMDHLCPVFLFIVVRAQIQRLGAEIRLIDDFVPQMNQCGSLTMMFTTLKACYYQILKERSTP